MANYMKEVAMLLGVELNKEFYIEEHNGKYRITETGVEELYNDGEGWQPSAVVPLQSILTGRHTIKRKWKPDNGKMYYFPDFGTNSLGSCLCWLGTETDKNLYNRGLVFQTIEEAVAMAKKILATV